MRMGRDRGGLLLAGAEPDQGQDQSHGDKEEAPGNFGDDEKPGKPGDVEEPRKSRGRDSMGGKQIIEDRPGAEGQGASCRDQDTRRQHCEHRQPGIIGLFLDQGPDHLPGLPQILEEFLLRAGRVAHDLPVVGDHVLRLRPGQHPAGPVLQPGEVGFFHGMTLLSLLYFLLLLKI
jgi:hypothetical protein